MSHLMFFNPPKFDSLHSFVVMLMLDFKQFLLNFLCIWYLFIFVLFIFNYLLFREYKNKTLSVLMRIRIKNVVLRPAGKKKKNEQTSESNQSRSWK